jgi:ankyrin repeat protein
MPRAFEIAIRKNNAELLDTFLSDKWLLPVNIHNKESQTGLMIACAVKAKNTANVLINRNAVLDARDTTGWTALHYAANSGSLDCVKLLIQHKIDIKAKTNNGQTPLHLACNNWRHLKLIKFLIEEQKADPAVTCNEGKTILHYAAEKGCLNILRYLIEGQKVDFEATENEGRTVLHIACQPHGFIHGSKSQKYLIEGQHRILEAKDKSGKTALHYCLEYFEEQKDYRFCEFQPIALILAAKAQTLKTEETNDNDYIFDWIKKGYDSCKHGSKGNAEEEIKCLNVGFLAFQKQLNKIRNKRGEQKQKIEPNPLLGIVANCNRVDIADYMFNEDLRYFEKQHFNADDANLGRTLVLESYLNFSCRAGWLDLTTFLFQEMNKRKDFFHNWSIDVSFLETACNSQNFEVFKFLFEEKEKEMVSNCIKTKLADIKTLDEEGETLLNYALKFGSVKIIQYLIEEKKACFDASYKHGRNALQFACNFVYDRLTVVKYILEKTKVDVNAQDEKGSTALHLACERENLKVIKFLINKMKANLNVEDQKGRTPLHVLPRSYVPKTQITTFLVNKGANVMAKDKSGESPLQFAISELRIKRYLVFYKEIEIYKGKQVTILEAATKR